MHNVYDYISYVLSYFKKYIFENAKFSKINLSKTSCYTQQMAKFATIIVTYVINF